MKITSIKRRQPAQDGNGKPFSAAIITMIVQHPVTGLSGADQFRIDEANIKAVWPDEWLYVKSKIAFHAPNETITAEHKRQWMETSK